MNDDIEILKAQIQNLRRNRRDGRPSPHKLVMLLAVIDLADEGLLVENRVYLNKALTDRFERHFVRYRRAGDWCQPGPPFFHLRSAEFWHHKVIPGMEPVYAKIRTSGGGTKLIHDTVEYAYLDQSSYALIKRDDTRRDLRRFIEDILRAEG
jgi:predicted restriction endonuclease